MSFPKRVISTRPQANQAAARSPNENWSKAGDDRLAATYEHAPVGILEIDRDGQILRVNRKVCELMGYDAAELLGRSIFNETSPLDVAQDLFQFRRQVAGEIDGYTLDKRLVRRDGTLVWAQVSSASVRDSAGVFLYAVRVQHDIRARRDHH